MGHISNKTNAASVELVRARAIYSHRARVVEIAELGGKDIIMRANYMFTIVPARTQHHCPFSPRPFHSSNGLATYQFRDAGLVPFSPTTPQLSQPAPPPLRSLSSP